MRRVPLGPGWGQPEIHPTTATVGSLELNGVGLVTSRDDGVECFSSAADWDAIPLERAYFELLERTTLLDCERLLDGQERIPLMDRSGNVIAHAQSHDVFRSSSDASRYVYAKSNGVAAHEDWSRACRAAEQEAMERDAVLRAWLRVGTQRPVCPTLTSRSQQVAQQLADLYDLQWLDFTDGTLVIAGCVGIPRQPERPNIMGFGSSLRARDAHEKSLRECVQQLVFLWDEDFSQHAEQWESLPAGPTKHQLAWGHPSAREHLINWCRTDQEPDRPTPVLRDSPSRFVDLTKLCGRGDGFKAVKVISDVLLPLVWGDFDYSVHLSHPLSPQCPNHPHPIA